MNYFQLSNLLLNIIPIKTSNNNAKGFSDQYCEFQMVYPKTEIKTLI